MKLDQFPRYPLTFGPTPIEKLERLSKHLGGNVEERLEVGASGDLEI